MNSRLKIILAAGVAGLIGIGGVAGLAQADRVRGGDGMRWHKGMHGPHGMGMQQHGRAFMERYDTNKDGKVTQEEIDANRSDWLKEFDTDNDGTLSLQEFQNLWLKARHERMVREFQRFDRDGDGKVTLEEYQRPLSDIVERMDRNGDGAISKDDRRQRWHRGERPRRGDAPRPMEQRDNASQDEDSQQSE